MSFRCSRLLLHRSSNSQCQCQGKGTSTLWEVFRCPRLLRAMPLQQLDWKIETSFWQSVANGGYSNTAQEFDSQCQLFCYHAGIFSIYEQPLASYMPQLRAMRDLHQTDTPRNRICLYIHTCMKNSRTSFIDVVIFVSLSRWGLSELPARL